MYKKKKDIKFRGMDIKTKKWCYGNHIYIKGVNEDGTEFEQTSITSFEAWGDLNAVYPETVGQYIGIKDTEGREIYEGDMIIFKPEKALFNKTALVNNNNNLMSTLLNSKIIKVLCNIYEDVGVKS